MFREQWYEQQPGVLAWMGGVSQHLNSVPTVLDYGAVGDGVTDDTAAFVAAIASSKLVIVPYATYLIALELTISDQHQLVGYGATLKASAAMDYIIGNTVASDPAQMLRISGLVLDGNGLATNGLQLYGISNNSSSVEAVWCKGATQDGLFLSRCQGGSWRALRGSGNGRNGLRLEGCNAAVLQAVSARDNTSDGIYITAFNGSSPSGACSLFGVHSESNGGSGLVFDTVLSRWSVVGGWLEQNTLHGVHIKDCTHGGTMEDMRVSGVGTADPENHAVHIENSSKGCYVHGNFLARESGETTYGVVHQTIASVSNVVTPNWDGVGELLT